MEKATGTKGQLTGDIPSGNKLEPPGHQPQTLAELGITQKQSSEWQAIASMRRGGCA